MEVIIANGNNDSTTNKYYAKVATWTEVTNTITTDDPEQETLNESVYNMTTTNVNYQDLTKSFIMPFDYLWSLLVITEDKDFVLEIADLVYNSKIEITVHDNLTVNTNVNVYTYTKKERTETSAKVSVNYNDISGLTYRHSDSASGDWTDEKENPYTTTYTTITKTNTLDTMVTLADVWMAKYTKTYEYTLPEKVESNSTSNLENIDYPSEPNKTTNNDTYGHANALLYEKKKQYEKYNPTGKIDFVNEKIYSATVNIVQNSTNTTEVQKYTSSPIEVKEKVDKYSEEPNFVNILIKDTNKKAMDNLLDVPDWLFEILENKETISDDLIDLTKYLLYKATGTNYGVTEFNFSEYAESLFTSVSGIYGDSIQEKIWFALKSEGYSDIAAAAVLGNIAQESRFQADIVNSIGASGLCQWLGGRKEQLVAYANSKGVDWSDVDTQIEFLLAELTPGGKGIATYQFLQKKYATGWQNATDIASATEAFCWGFERCGKNEARMSYRISMAEKYYNEFQGRTIASDDSRIGTISLRGDNSEKMLAMLNEACRICDDDRYTYSQANRYGEYQYDCSSFVSRLYLKFFAINIPNSTIDYANFSQYYVGEYGSVTLKPGDVLWRSGHVELYLGNGNRVGAHGSSFAIPKQISISSSPGDFTSVYRFIN